MSYSKFDPSKDISTQIIRCPYSKCHTRIIKPNTTKTHDFENSKIAIDFLKVDNNTDQSNDGADGIFLKINDAWDFDNIGVSKEIPNDESEIKIERLIICSDCERGPLGFAKFDDDEKDKSVQNLKYYLHLNSCLYQ